jgi:hypothetical protein
MFLWCGLGWFDFALWHLGLHTSWRAFQFYFSPSILQLANRHADVVPDWLSKNDWLYNAAVQRLWVEQFGDAMMAAPIKKLAEDAQIFEKKVVEPFIGLPEQTHAVSSMADWEDKLAGIRGSSSNIGKGEGLFGFFLETVAGAMHWFEENWVLRGSGEGLLNFLQRLGTYLTHIDYLICQPRYLLIMIILTFIIIV